MMRYGLIMAGALALGGVVAACSVPVDLGQRAYEDNCVSCHGPTGQGDGPLAAGLNKRPADLTTISRRNGGTFPVAQVMSTIDGYTRGQHGGAQTMPEFGDLLRGRTVRSLSYLLTNYPNIRQVFVAPEPLQVGADVLAILKEKGVVFERTDDFHAAIPHADAVYMTRIQDEWDTAQGESAKIDTRRFKFGLNELKLLPPRSIIMHPLPRRDEIATDVDSDPRAMYWRQMRNGMWIRTALIAMTFGCEKRIHEYYRQNN